VSVEELSVGLADSFNVINTNETTDKEIKFLQLAAVAFNYRQSGNLPFQKEISFSPCPPEEKKYCTAVASHTLNEILSEESLPLLKLWLEKCNKNHLVVQPGTIPALLEIASNHKSFQTLVASCCGKRGEWLSNYNDSWKFSMAQSIEEIWQTGTPEQRKNVLIELRETDSKKARDYLMQTWGQEDANTKTEFLELLANGISKDDIAFLESLATEKSKKVKEAALKLLKLIPESAIIQQYQEIIRQAVFITKKKEMLGLSSKTVLEFKLPEQIPEAIFKTGIEKLAGITTQKNISDSDFILYQIVGFIPPAFWESHLNASPAEIIDIFQATNEGEKLIPAIGMATGRFKSTQWALLFASDPNSFYLDIVSLLPKQKREEYLINQFRQASAAETIINLAVKEETEWSNDLATNIMKHTSKNPYQYNRAFYNQHINLIPESVIPNLEQMAPTEDHLRSTWINIMEYIKKIIVLKSQTEKAFNL
jgi:Family of unknown function (DUF5691)